MTLSEELKKILVCPVCHARIREALGGEELECTACGRRYPVRDGFPVMIAEEKSEEASRAAEPRRPT